MRIYCNNIFIFAIFVCAILISCTSIKEPKEVFSVPDYTEDDIKQNEIKKIEKLAEETPVQALWRSILLGDEDTKEKYESNVFSLLEKAISEKDFFSATKYYTSLKSIESEKIKNLKMSEKDIFSSFFQDIPGLSLNDENKSLLPKNMADCVNATVTIWVDKGIKIEHGAGYADRVIGSGFFIDKRGYIVTNHHVINDLVDPKNEKFSRLFIKLARDAETRIPAKVIGYDETIDLALLKAEIDPPFILALGSSEDLQIGERVNAIGTPLGLHGTLTSGIISAVDRKLFTTGSVLQIDAAVNSGNSGGPCIDSKMRVQAIVFAGILQYQGLNFAIPVEYLKQDLPFLYNGGKRSHVWISSYGHTMKEGLTETGLEVQYVMPGGVSNRAGLQKGDVITFVANKKINSLENMQDVLRNYVPENILKINYTRDDKSFSTLVYLAERPKQPGYEMSKHDLLSGSFVPIFGMGLTLCSTTWQRKYYVSELIKGSIADESGFSLNDQITIYEVRFSPDKDAVSVTLQTKKRKKGYLDVTIGIGAGLDSPYYF